MKINSSLFKVNKLIFISALIFVIENVNAQAVTSLNILEVNQSANNLYEQGLFQEAKEQYAALALANPSSSEILSRLWEINLELSLWGDVIEVGQILENIGHKIGASFAFNMAVANIHLGNQEETLNWLETALAEKYDNRTGLYSNSLFSALRNNPRFIQLTGFVPRDLDRISGWRADVEFYKQEAIRLHEHPDNPALSIEFQQAADNLNENIAALSDQEILMEFNKLAAILGDGHSTIYGPTIESTGSYIEGVLPVKLYDFSDGLFIVNATEEYQDLIGSRVIRLGTISPEEAFDRLLMYRGVDNPMTIRWLGAQFYLRDLGPLQAIGANVDGRSQTMLIEKPDGSSETIILEGGDSTFPRKLRPPVTDLTAVPLYLQRVDDNYWFENLSEVNATYFQFNQVRNNSEQDTLNLFAEELLENLQANEINNLIIDVRHNNGGNNTLFNSLLNKLIVFDNEPGNRIFVFTSKNTFSAAQNFINRLEGLTDAIFVGEPSSSSPNFTGEETSVLFPWSRIAASISNRYWQDSTPTDRRQWIAPDMPVQLSSEQYFNNIDPVLETVIALLNN